MENTMNGFDDFDTQVTAEEYYTDEAVQQEDAMSHSWDYEDQMAQYDNDPSPYDGTYSEE
jgi:hypothetical protein